MKSRWWCGAPAPRPSLISRASSTGLPTSPPPQTTMRPRRRLAGVFQTWPPAKPRRRCRLCRPTTVPPRPDGCWSTAPRPGTAAAAAWAWGRWRGGPREGRPRSWTGSRGSCTTLTRQHWRAPGWRRPTGTTTSSWPPSTLEARYRNLVVGCIFIISSVLPILTTATWWRILDMSPYLTSLVRIDRRTVCVRDVEVSVVLLMCASRHVLQTLHTSLS